MKKSNSILSLKKTVNRPIIAISTGDPSGIGPEITMKALNHEEVYKSCRPLVVCDARVLEKIIALLHLSLQINVVAGPESGKYVYGTVDVIDLKNANPETFGYGKVSEIAGKASFEYVKKVIEMALGERVDATVTGPINKEAIHKAGIQFAGHTEIFAHFTRSANYAMMLAEGSFRVVHVNTHVSMLEAINRITKERVLSVIRLADEALKRMGIEKPRIAVNGLNPHAGENGLFGTEEISHIIPAIKQAQSEGINADGPHPSDTIFSKMKGGLYDMVVCMYHDQGHIPVKLLGFRYNNEKNEWEGLSGINITLGLPIVRVSVDHGTAFEIAGKGWANPQSMQQAISYAIKLSKNKS
jgi:4-phospho-D-threonate 3-dehydrogenase / 4-phospho-D-erythronate 3-dehydrogenase